jgi:hypothetical protein
MNRLNVAQHVLDLFRHSNFEKLGWVGGRPDLPIPILSAKVRLFDQLRIKSGLEVLWLSGVFKLMFEVESHEKVVNGFVAVVFCVRIECLTVSSTTC